LLIVQRFSEGGTCHPEFARRTLLLGKTGEQVNLQAR
jgi:hypothetical protein